MTTAAWIGLGVAIVGGAVGAGLAYLRITEYAARHLERFLADALDTDPWDHMDDLIDREARLGIEHQNTDGRCDTCGTTWPCIPLRTLGITKEPA